MTGGGGDALARGWVGLTLAGTVAVGVTDGETEGAAEGEAGAVLAGEVTVALGVAVTTGAVGWALSVGLTVAGAVLAGAAGAVDGATGTR